MPLEDGDMLLIQRGETLHKTTYKELKEQIAADLGIPFVSDDDNTPNNDY